MNNLKALQKAVKTNLQHQCGGKCALHAADRVVGVLQEFDMTNEFLKDVMELVHAELVGRTASPAQVITYLSNQTMAVMEGYKMVADDETNRFVMDAARTIMAKFKASQEP